MITNIQINKRHIGIGAGQADDKCYEKFNPTGNFNGHCGQLSEDSFRKCEIE